MGLSSPGWAGGITQPVRPGEAFSIALLVLAAASDAERRETHNHTKLLAYVRETEEATERCALRSISPLISLMPQAAGPTMGGAMHPMMGELVGARLMESMGLRAAHGEIVPFPEATKANRREVVVKVLIGGRLHCCHANDLPKLKIQPMWAFVSPKVPGSVSLSHLKVRFGISSPVPVLGMWTDRHSFEHFLFDDRREAPHAAELYADFKLPANPSAIRRTIMWNSIPMLELFAARLFLCTGTPHLGNLLVNSTANLFSIDHDTVYASDGAEIDLAFENVKPRTAAFAALERPGRLSESAVRNAFEELPRFPWPLGSREATIQYYISRLQRWKAAIRKNSF